MNEREYLAATLWTRASWGRDRAGDWKTAVRIGAPTKAVDVGGREVKPQNKENNMELKDTIEGMLSADYKARCKAERDQLEIRLGKLRAMLEKYDAGTLPFTPTCPIELLRVQEQTMTEYLTILKWRAAIEE